VAISLININVSDGSVGGALIKRIEKNTGGRWSSRDGQIKENQYIASLLKIPDSMEDHIKVMRKIHKGNAVRDISKAKRCGYFCDLFLRENYIPDIFEINHSKPIRQGRPMAGGYTHDIEKLGGEPHEYKKIFPINLWNPNDWCCWIGVFIPEKSHQQGKIITDKRLCGYINFYRSGELGVFNQILGHGSHLKNGIMYFLYEYIISRIVVAPIPIFKNIRYIYYGPHTSGTKGLHLWKKRTLFKPCYINKFVK